MTDEQMAAIRRALIGVIRNPTQRPQGDNAFTTLLVNGGWAQPHAWIDIFVEPSCLRNEWRLSYTGEAYMAKHPMTIDELSSKLDDHGL